MNRDDVFKPLLGRMRAKGNKKARKYLSRVLAAANLARSGSASGGRRNSFAGGRIGRGSGIGRVVGSRDRWAAVDHINTGHPHTHILLRGKDDAGKELIIAREYITQGMRERAAELIDLDLGPHSTDAIQDKLRGEVDQERLTSIA